jgi:polyisoprenoid-binding protein YceI
MKRLNHILISISTFLFVWISLPVPAQTIDESGSKVVFRIGNMLVNTVEGTFTGMKGAINFNEQDLANSGFAVCVDATTVETGIEKRDNHLLEEVFFYSEQYPVICFESKTITRSDEGYRVAGDLTIRDVTRAIEFPFTFDGKTFEGSFELERLDYNVGKGYSRIAADNDVEVRIVCVVE